MKTVNTYLLLILTISTIVIARASDPHERLRVEQLDLPDGTATFILRGSNLVYERVTIKPAALGNSDSTTTNHWAERFYYKGRLAYRRCRTDDQLVEISLGVPGLTIHHGQAMTNEFRGRMFGKLTIVEEGQSSIPGGKGWTPPFEVFHLDDKGLYHPADRMQELFSSFLWVSDLGLGNPGSEDKVKQLRQLLLRGAAGEPVAAPNAASPNR